MLDPASSLTPAAATILVMAIGAPAAPAERIGSPASAEHLVLVPPAYDPQDTFGGSLTVQTVRIEQIPPPNSGVTYASVVNAASLYRYQTAPAMPTDWWGPVYLPSGAIVDRLEMEACDTTATGQILFGLSLQIAPQGPSGNISPTGTTGAAATPGCAFFTVPVTTTAPVNNRSTSYTVYVNFAGNTSTATRVSAFRVFYRLQVSPAPATATFPNDVPTSHPAFRFVEALAAAGITGGCGAGSFCPDAPLTRSQMAVFLSVALGLHFPD